MMTVRRDGERIDPRPGAPEPRPPARFATPARAGSYDGPVPHATCGTCAKCDRRKGFMGRREVRCSIAVTVAANEGRRLPDTVSPTRPACSRYKSKGRRR